MRKLGNGKYKDSKIGKNLWYGIPIGIILFLSPMVFASEQAQGDISTQGASVATPDDEGAVIDTDTQPLQAYHADPNLSLGGKFSIQLQDNHNSDLSNAVSDNALSAEPEFTLAGWYRLSPRMSLLAEVKSKVLFSLRDDAHRLHRGSRFKLGENYWLWQNPSRSPIAVQIGRQRFKDHREWWYNEKLDTARLLYRKSRVEFDLSVSAKLIDAAGDTHTNYIISGNYQSIRSGELVAHTIFQEDRKDPSHRPVWHGLSWRGKPYKGHKTWIDFAVERGYKNSKKIRGGALDVGWVLRSQKPLKPSLTLDYAYGSGDRDATDSVNKSFRQTGFQGNDGVFGGIAKFKYYGETLSPELSNLSIWTGGLGLRPMKNASLDFVYHRYRQVEKDRNARFKIKQLPTGLDTQIGQEVDLILGAVITKKMLVSLASGVFIPGPAYLQQDSSVSGKINFEYTF